MSGKSSFRAGVSLFSGVDGMRDTDKTKEQFLEKLAELRRKITALEAQEAERRQVQEALVRSEQNFRNSLDTSPLGVRIVTADGELLYVNQAFLDICSYGSVEELKTVPRKKLYTPESYAEHTERKEKRLRGEFVPPSYELGIVRKDGGIRHLQVFRKEIIWNGTRQFQALYQDITERKQAEAKATYLNQILQVLRRVNQLMGRVDKEPKLLQEACNELVRNRHYRLVWIGLKQEGSYDILPVAHAGYEDGYLASVKITWDNSEYGQGPTGTAIKTGKPSIVRDSEQDPRCRPWREEALKRNYHSSISFPLIIEHDRVIGALNVHSDQPNAFAEDEVELLTELANDISIGIERIRQKAMRRWAEEKYQTILNLSWDGFYLCNTKGKFLEVNESCCQMLGYTREELLKMSVQDIEAKETPEEIAQRTKVIKGKGYDRFESRFQCKDGTSIDVDITANYINMDGGRLFVFIRDITERKRVEAALQESKELFEKTFTSQLDAIFILDAGNPPTILECNPAATDIFGYTQQEMLGHTTDLLHIDQAALRSFQQQLYPIIDQQGFLHLLEFSMKRKDGTIFPTEHSIIPLKDEQGKRIGWVSVVRDITERKRAEAKAREMETLKELDRLRTQLLANVSHELRTPLASIKGFATVLLSYDKKLKREEKREYLETINKSADRLTELIQQLLDMSQLDAGALPMDKKPAGIVKLLREAVAEARVRSPTHRFTLDMARRLPKTNIDARRIRQVMDNLIDNAIKYSPTGTEVMVTARRFNYEILISVTDQGIGISADDMPRIFDRLFRSHHRPVPGKEGAGLGLSICKSLVEAHGGRIWIESEEGKGTRCFFTLPIYIKTDVTHDQKNQG